MCSMPIVSRERTTSPTDCVAYLLASRCTWILVCLGSFYSFVLSVVLYCCVAVALQDDEALTTTSQKFCSKESFFRHFSPRIGSNRTVRTSSESVPYCRPIHLLNCQSRTLNIGLLLDNNKI